MRIDLPLFKYRNLQGLKCKIMSFELFQNLNSIRVRSVIGAYYAADSDRRGGTSSIQIPQVRQKLYSRASLFFLPSERDINREREREEGGERRGSILPLSSLLVTTSVEKTKKKTTHPVIKVGMPSFLCPYMYRFMHISGEEGYLCHFLSLWLVRCVNKSPFCETVRLRFWRSCKI